MRGRRHLACLLACLYITCVPARRQVGQQPTTCLRLTAASAAFTLPVPHTLPAARRPTCFKRKCTKPKRKARFTDRPAYRVAGVTTYAGCCKRCRIATGCVRFQISAKGCAIYRTEPRRKAVRAAGYVVGYSE